MDIVLRANGNRLGESMIQGDGSWTIYPDRPLEEGRYFVNAEHVDPSTGKIGPTSEDFVINIHPEAAGKIMMPTTPQMYWYDGAGRQMSGTDTSAEDVWFEGYADPSIFIVLMENQQQIGETYTDQNGKWSIYTYEPLGPGYYDINAYAESDNGMQSDWSQTCLLYTSPSPRD